MRFRSSVAHDLDRTRRTALQHALLSYVFGAVFVAITVNSVAAVLNR